MAGNQTLPRTARRVAPLAVVLALVALLGGLVSCLVSRPAGPWQTAAPSPIARFEAQGAVIDGKLYVFGGFYNSRIDATVRSDVYDPAANAWTRIADLPEPITHAPVVVDGTTAYLVGGYLGAHPGGSTTHVWKYDTRANMWHAAPPLLAPRGAGGAALLGRTLHYFGGTSRAAGSTDDPDHDDHWALPLDADQGDTAWEPRAPLPNPRNHLVGVALGDRIYAIGGQRGHYEGTANQAQVDVYDPAADAWSRAADLPVARGHVLASAFVMEGRIVAIGGSVDDGGCCGASTADITAYDPQANVWVRLPSLPAGRKSPVAGLIGGRILVTTGNPGGGTPHDATWVTRRAGTWESGPAMPITLGEVAGGIVGNTLYLVGEGSPATLALNLSTGAWSNPEPLARRPFPGHHHAAEVVNGRLYLLGGLDAGAGKVQIYDPEANAWSIGADMPFAAGSSASALIDGKIYVAGGIVGETTTADAARYDPATNTWVRLASMKQGRNHAAGATDGRRLYVFGGRGAGSGDGNFVANGFDTVQVYVPATNTWTSSQDAGVGLAPLPLARGGMGRAVYTDGEFYVVGGETENGPGATRQRVYQRVDVYNPQTNTWRLGAPMPTARHGIAPLLLAGRIYVAGGGVRAGASASSVVEIYNPAPPGA